MNTRTRTILSILTALLAMFVLVACGGNATYSPVVKGGAPVVGITVTPATSNTTPGGTVQFTAHVTGTDNTAVNWSVLQEGGGTISQSGLYMAPNGSVPTVKSKLKKAAAKWEDDSSATYTIQAVSQADPTKSATAQVTVSGNATVSITITPATANSYPTGQVQFTAHVTGVDDTSVTWAIQSGPGGTISGTGLFTSEAEDFAKPKNASRENNFDTYVIKATSVADPSATATATVTTRDLQIVINNTPLSTPANTTLKVTATVTGATADTILTDKSVTWSCLTDGGTIDANGNFSASQPGAYEIVAKAHAEPIVQTTTSVKVTSTQEE